MANWNTIAGFLGGSGRNQIVANTVSTISSSIFKVQTDSGTAVDAVLSVPNGSGVIGASTPLDVNANSAITGFNFGAFGGRPNGTNAPWYSSTSFDASRGFKVRITGTIVSSGVATQTAEVGIYIGTTTGTAVATTAAHDVATAGTYGFTIEARLFWDAGSQTVSGWADTSIGGTSVANAGLTAITGIAAITDLTFVGAGTVGAAAGAVTFNASEFVIDQI